MYIKIVIFTSYEQIKIGFSEEEKMKVILLPHNIPYFKRIILMPVMDF